MQTQKYKPGFKRIRWCILQRLSRHRKIIPGTLSHIERMLLVLELEKKQKYTNLDPTCRNHSITSISP